MVREEAFNQQFVVFFVSSFVPFVRSFLPKDFCCTEFADGPYFSAGWCVTGKTVRGPFADSQLLRVQHWCQMVRSGQPTVVLIPVV
jgi:hypothetical protein